MGDIPQDQLPPLVYWQKLHMEFTVAPELCKCKVQFGLSLQGLVPATVLTHFGGAQFVCSPDTMKNAEHVGYGEPLS